MSHDDIFKSRYGPRTARGGIKSQTPRGTFGKNWWAKRWLQVLETLELGGRLARGRNYARHGQVLSIDIQEGLIESKVQGSRFQPYLIEIRVKTIPAEKWSELSDTAFSQAIVAAKLLAGEMPQDIENLFAEHQLSLFPKSMEDIKTECSCPDFSNPCKHIASVFYLLSEEFDRDPFLIFRMRGMSKEKLLDLITKTEKFEQSPDAKDANIGKAGARSKKNADARFKNTADDSAPVIANKVASEKASKSGGGSRTNAKPPAFPLEDFWKVLPCDHLVGSVVSPTINAGLPKRLGNFSFWRSSYPFIPTLEQIYKTASDAAVRDLSKEKFDSNKL